MALGLEAWSRCEGREIPSLSSLKKLKENHEKGTIEEWDLLSPFLFSRGPHAMHRCCPHLQRVFLAQFTQSGNLHGHAQSLHFWMTLDSSSSPSIFLVFCSVGKSYTKNKALAVGYISAFRSEGPEWILERTKAPHRGCCARILSDTISEDPLLSGLLSCIGQKPAASPAFPRQYQLHVASSLCFGHWICA
jgi:hypothetical protein